MRLSLLLITVASASAHGSPPGATPPQTPIATTPAPAPGPAQPPAPVPPPALTPIDAAAVPPPCADLARRSASPEPGIARISRVSAALCIARERARAVAVCDCEQSVHDLDDAVGPALAILDELAIAGDPAWRIIALHAEGDLYTQLASSVLAAVPALPPNATAEQGALHDVRLQLVQPLVEQWLTRSHDLFGEVDRVAKQHPELGKNAAAQSAIRDSRLRLAPNTALR